MESYKIIDISQPISSQTACFPGDVPFSKNITLNYQDGKVINLTSLSMSPHVGTHADAPIHCYGDITAGVDTAGTMPLQPFIGPAVVMNIAPIIDVIKPEHIQEKLSEFKEFPKRILFKTTQQVKHEAFDNNFAYFSNELVKYLAANKVILAGIDTPSVDQAKSKTLEAHHTLINAQMFWLENLDLTQAEEGNYFLIACPLKFMELEASPVRAVLLKGNVII